jgi:hypothetical protein
MYLLLLAYTRDFKYVILYTGNHAYTVNSFEETTLYAYQRNASMMLRLACLPQVW